MYLVYSKSMCNGTTWSWHPTVMSMLLSYGPSLSNNKYRASILIWNGVHSHDRDDTYIRSGLRQCQMTEAADIKMKSHIPFCDGISFLQQSHGILIDRASIQRRLRWELRKALPVAGDFIRLIQALTGIKTKHPSVVFSFTVSEHQRLPNVWWTFPECLGEYETFGIGPVLSIDVKALQNVYSIRLVSRNGKTKGGNSLSYVKGLFQDQN